MGYMINKSTGVVTRDIDGVQVAPSQSTDDPAYIEYINWVAQGQHPVEIDAPDAPDMLSDTQIISKSAFRNRFTTEEKIALDMSSIDDISASPDVRHFAATVRVFMKDLDASDFVDLSCHDVRIGLTRFATAGVLQQSRVLEILKS